MSFFKHPIFFSVVLIQFAGLFYFGLSDWANIIQYVSGFGVVYGLWAYIVEHKPEMQRLREQVAHLHRRHDELQQMISGKGEQPK